MSERRGDSRWLRWGGRALVVLALPAGLALAVCWMAGQLVWDVCAAVRGERRAGRPSPGGTAPGSGEAGTGHGR